MVKLIEKDLVYKITGCAIEVLNELGHGLREKTYERALCIEMESQNISYEQQKAYPVYYKNIHIDDYIPDFLVENAIIVDIKTVERIVDEHVGQILNYLKISKLKIGMVVNFKHPKLEWKRIVL
ncbi:MAG: GxxExxY protein [Candidatus Anammoxibacter sp.]